MIFKIIKYRNYETEHFFINDVHGYLATHPELFYDQIGEVIEIVGGYVRKLILKIGVIVICAIIVDKVMPQKVSKGLKFLQE